MPTKLFQKIIKIAISTSVQFRSMQCDQSINRRSKKKTYIRGVANELPKEDLLVGVEGVDDQAQQLVDLRLEGEGLGLSHLLIRH